MSVEIDFHVARQTLLDRLAVMAALQPYADPGNASSALFVKAFELAREEALIAAEEYLSALLACRNSTTSSE